eukprot:866069_1
MLSVFVFLYICTRTIQCTSADHMHGPIMHSTRILFGSCAKSYLPQPLWPSIVSRNPDVWIWTGDIVYHDRPNANRVGTLLALLVPQLVYHDRFRWIFGATEPRNYDYNFQQQLDHPGYKQLLTNNTTKIIGTWDDHDYGQDDGDYTNPNKYEAKEALLSFLSVPNDDPIRSRSGMYSFHSHTFGTITIDIYLLDVRWFVDVRNNILFGDEQWTWLHHKIKGRTALNESDISVFVSGVQMLPFYRGFWTETWSAKSNGDRTKFIETILSFNVSNPVFVSGDVHWGEQMRYNCYNPQRNEYKSLYEITSSGLTHSWSHTYPTYHNMLKDMSKYLDADGTTIGWMNELNFGEMEVLHENGNIENIYLRVYGVEGVSLEMDLMQSTYAQIDERGRDIMRTHFSDKNANGHNWICVGYNQPNIWTSRLYVILVALLIMMGLLPGLFAITGGCCGCYCCCSWLRVFGVGSSGKMKTK